MSSPARSCTAPEAPRRLELRALFHEHYASIWRLLRRLGVRDVQLDDASQEVFWVAARRLDEIRAGSEHAFLYGVALRVASDVRRRSSAQPWAAGWEPLEGIAGDQPDAEQELDQRRARELLNVALDSMPQELRAVFVLFELEGLSVKDISQLEELPQGTVSSRPPPHQRTRASRRARVGEPSLPERHRGVGSGAQRRRRWPQRCGPSTPFVRRLALANTPLRSPASPTFTRASPAPSSPRTPRAWPSKRCRSRVISPPPPAAPSAFCATTPTTPTLRASRRSSKGAGR